MKRKKKNETIINERGIFVIKKFSVQNFIDRSTSEKRFKRFKTGKFKEKFLRRVTIRKEWFSIEIYRCDRHFEKKKKKEKKTKRGTQKPPQLLLPFCPFYRMSYSYSSLWAPLLPSLYVTDLRPIVNHSLSSLSSTSSVS